MSNPVLKDKISIKIEERSNEITDLIAEFREVFGDNVEDICVKVEGKDYLISSHNRDVGPLAKEDYIRMTHHEVENQKIIYFEDVIFYAPGVGWKWVCNADRAWDHETTTVDTMARLHTIFESECVGIKLARTIIDTYKRQNKTALDFFGV